MKEGLEKYTEDELRQAIREKKTRYWDEKIVELVEQIREEAEKYLDARDRNEIATVTRHMERFIAGLGDTLKSYLKFREEVAEQGVMESDPNRSGYVNSKPEDCEGVSAWNGDGSKKLEPVEAVKIEPVKHEKVCRRGKASCEGCEWLDGKICRGIVFPTDPPQYPECEFKKGSN